MGYLITQIAICLLCAAGIGLLAGYLLKQLQGSKAAEQLSRFGAQKCRRRRARRRRYGLI